MSQVADWCTCRDCGKKYDQNKSRCEYMGYCSAKCMYMKAGQFGWKPPKIKHAYNSEKSYSAFTFLRTLKLIGRVPYVSNVNG